MMIKFNVSYCKGSTPIEVESQEGGKRAGLSFQLGVACDAQALHLVGWVVMLANEIISRFMS